MGKIYFKTNLRIQGQSVKYFSKIRVKFHHFQFFCCFFCFCFFLFLFFCCFFLFCFFFVVVFCLVFFMFFFFFFLFFFFSSPEHEVLMVSYCGQSMSVVRHASCGVRHTLCVVRRPASTIALKAYSSYTPEPIDSILGRKHRGDLQIKNS